MLTLLHVLSWWMMYYVCVYIQLLFPTMDQFWEKQEKIIFRELEISMR